jgi:hypothetical protein
MAYLILSCDGGGIRGLITALLLQDLEKDFGILGLVKLFAGTSTGGILALALASGLGIDAIVNVYQNDGAQIFTPLHLGELDALLERLKLAPRPPTGDPQMHNIIEQVWKNLDSLFYVRYNNTGLASVRKSLLPNRTLRELRNVMVTTFQLDSPEGWQPITINNVIANQGADSLPVDAALSTGAAPTYFPPYKHPQYGYCVDGGVFANNPSSLALAVALQAGTPLSEIVMLSLGTGFAIQKMEIVLPPTFYGPLLWLLPIALPSMPATPLIEVLLSGVGPADSFQCQQILDGNFMRADVPLPTFISMDNYRAVDQLQSAAESYIRNSPAWQQVRAWVGKLL